MSAHDFKTTVLPALLVGTSRQPIDFSRLSDAAISPADPKSGLKALALTGQALRFERPAPPSDYAAIPIRNPSRRNVPEALRPMLVRMFGDGDATVLPFFRSGYHDSLQLAMALAFEARRLQPHPFDFHLMRSFLRAHAERLGPAACRWVDREKGAEEKRGYFDVDELNDGNWHQTTPARRQQYIEDRRRQDANAGRALVEAVWPNEAADLRVSLLQALRQGLCSADAAFLEGLAKDRAPRVRELAERYLSRLPGATGQNPALRSVMERIVRHEAGFIRKRVTLKLELPATVIGNGWRGWVAESFEEVEVDELARGLGLGAAEMIAAAAQDRCLPTALTIMAFRQGNTAIARQAYEATPETQPRQFAPANLINLHWGTLVKSDGGRGTFREAWRVSWRPEFSIALAEALVFGVTVEEAASNATLDRAARTSSIAELADLVRAALVADLESTAKATISRLQEAAVSASDITDLMKAVSPLVTILRYGTARKLPGEALRALVTALAVEVNAGVRLGSHQLDEQTARARLAAMRDYDEAVGFFGDHALLETWRRQLALMLDDDQVTASIAGFCLRRLHDLRIWDEGTVAAAFSRHIGGRPPLLAGGFLESFLSGGAEIVLQDRPLLHLVDAWLCRLGEEDFMEALPLLRRSFTSFDADARKRLLAEIGKGGRETVSFDAMEQSGDNLAFDRALPLLLRILGVGVEE
jgi:hypothetical protein